MEEPLSNIGFNATCRPDLKLAKRSAKWFVGKFAKIAFPAARKGRRIKEWMWVWVTSARNGRCHGRLDNDPLFTSKVKCGDAASFLPKQVAEVTS